MKKLISYILTFLLIITLIALVLITCVKEKALTSDNVLKMFDNTNFYENTYKTLNENFSNYMEQSGLDESVIKDICTEDDVKNGVETILGNIYEGTNNEINSESVREKLVSNINNSLSGTKITPDMQKAIDTFVDTIVNEYTSTMSHFKYESQINDVYSKVNKLTKFGEKAGIVAVIAFVVVLLLLNIKNINRFLGQIGISLTSSGAFLLISNFIVSDIN